MEIAEEEMSGPHADLSVVVVVVVGCAGIGAHASETG